MNKHLMILVIICLITGIAYSQQPSGIFRTGVVLQKWSIENMNDPISQGTFPIEVIYPVRENINLQINHSPGISQYAGNILSGLSDTWIRGTYSLSNKRVLISFGVGLPTGKTQLKTSEMTISYLLSQNIFKFRLPVYGQGLTLNGGVMYAYSVSEKLAVGAGLNYVFRGKYKISKDISTAYDPGDQIGVNLGLDYLITPKFRSNFDLIYSYYSADKFDNIKAFVSGPKITTQLGGRYYLTNGYIQFALIYRSKGKNENWNGQTLVPDNLNSNGPQREMDIGARLIMSNMLSLLFSAEVRSYMENEAKHGWADVLGGGIGYDLSVTQKLNITMTFKLFYGDGEFNNESPTFLGTELYIGTRWKL